MINMVNQIKVLYVDDEPINLIIFDINFNKKYTVFTAKSGFAGLEILESNPDISIIVSDMRMAKMNGIQFINKAKESFPDKKYFILSGYEITDEIKEAIESGLIIQYFSKPFDKNEIETAFTESLH